MHCNLTRVHDRQMIRSAWDPLLDSLIEELQRAKKVVDKQRMDDEQRATFDAFIVRCLNVVINTSFNEGSQP